MDRVARAYFKVCSSWAAITLLVRSCSYDEEDSVMFDSEGNICATNLAYLLPFMNDVEWDTLVMQVIERGDLKTKHALYQLMKQKLAALKNTEVGFDGPGAVTAKFILQHADDDWMASNAECLVAFIDPETKVTLAKWLVGCEKQHEKLGTLLSAKEFQENRSMVTAVCACLLEQVGDICAESGNTGLQKLTTQLKLCSLLTLGRTQNFSEVTNNMNELSVILIEDIKSFSSDCKPVDISSRLKRKWQLIEQLPIAYLQSNARVAILLLLLGAARSMVSTNTSPLFKTVFGLITSMVDNCYPAKMPYTFHWPTLLRWIAASSKGFSYRLHLLRCLIKSAFREVELGEGIIETLTSNSHRSDVILCTMIANDLDHMVKSKFKFGANKKDDFLDSCHRLIYCCVKQVLYGMPACLELVPTFRIVLQYHLKPKKISVNAESKEKMAELVPQYISVITNTFTKIKGRVFGSNMYDNDEKLDMDFTSGLATKEFEEEGNLMMFLLENRKKLDFSLPGNVILLSWAALNPYLPKAKLHVFMQSVTKKEFKKMLDKHSALTVQLLENPALKAEVCLLWEVIIMANVGYEKSLLRQNAIDQLSTLLVQLAFHSKTNGQNMYFHDVLVALISNLKIKVTSTHIEMCLEVISATHDTAPETIISKCLLLLSSMLRFRKDLIVDLVPQFLQRFIHIMSVITNNHHHKSSCDEFAFCAFLCEKLAINISNIMSKDFSRALHFAISDFVIISSQSKVNPDAKVHLNNTVFRLLSICDPNTIDYQIRLLPPASKEIFKRVYNEYRRHHKFTGKL